MRNFLPWQISCHPTQLRPSSQSGFTLIELIIVFSIMVILSSLGFAGYVTYSHSQAVDTNMKEFKSVLFTARSRALSQLRDSACFSSGFTGQGLVLLGYRVGVCCKSKLFVACFSSIICSDPTANYQLDAVYGYADGSGVTYQTCASKKFSDPNIIFSPSLTTATTIFFSSVTGAVTTSSLTGLSQVGITGYGYTKLATVSATGVIQ